MKQYDFDDYNSISSFFKLMKSDYLKYTLVWNAASKEEKPDNEKNFYRFIINEYFSKFLIDNIQDSSISDKLLPKNPTNTKLPFLLYFCVYFKEFNCPTEDFYLAYLFDKSFSKVFLTLVLGSSNNLNFDSNLACDNLEGTKNKFKEYIDSYQQTIFSELNINLENYDNQINLGTFDSKDMIKDINSQNNKASDYENGSIYIKSYEIDNLPPENELIEDFNNFVKLYDFILNRLFNDAHDVSGEAINFDKALNIVKKVLKNNGTVIDENYDMILVKELDDADIIPANKINTRNNTTHIALTSEKMDLFPFLESFEYFFNEKGKYDFNSKTRFLLEVPVVLYESNLQYLDMENIFSASGNEQIFTTATILRSRKNDNDWSLEKLKRQVNNLEDDDYKIRMKLLGYEVQAELSSKYSGEKFKFFRKLLYKEYFLIILKHKNELKYDFFAILPEDGEELKQIDFKLFKLTSISPTLVSPSSWHIENKLNESFLQGLWSRPFRDDEIKTGGKNMLYYGVPGSGKSFTIEKKYGESNVERVVFHPDYTYSDFIGQILPKLVDGKVNYEFSEGPFTAILMKACANADKRYYLIIEEINRGNAPAIFGDIFQLLDRKINPTENYPIGTSEYAVTNSDIAEKVYRNKDHKIRIPPNLSIIATMNTADQNVFTLDTAFQRRWEMKLIPNKFEKDHDFAEKEILDSNVKWKNFVNIVNDLILKKNTLTTSTEDKRIGVYFIKKEDLNDKDKFAEKVLKYLWDDAFKFYRDQIFVKDCKCLEDLVDLFKGYNGDHIFDIFLNKEQFVSEESNDKNEE